MSVVTKDVLVSQQWLETSGDVGAQIRTALGHIRPVLESDSGAGISGGRIKLEELPLSGFLSLQADANNVSLQNACGSVFGVSLPNRLSSESQGACTIRWMGPSEWLVSAPLDKLYAMEQDIRQRVSGKLSMVNVSGGLTALELTGSEAVKVLKKSTPYDVHAGNFPTGKVVNTTFAKAQATLRALDSGYEIIVRRSFADYVWNWLCVAADEYVNSMHD